MEMTTIDRTKRRKNADIKKAIDDASAIFFFSFLSKTIDGDAIGMDELLLSSQFIAIEFS